jgi:hypothetical protein
MEAGKELDQESQPRLLGKEMKSHNGFEPWIHDIPSFGAFSSRK